MSAETSFLTPAKVRWLALRDLWCFRNNWRMPGARGAMRAERDTEMAETMPIVLVLAAVLGVSLFVLLPSSMGEQSSDILRLFWPKVVTLGAPLACALVMALLNAPAIALRLTEHDSAGDFAGEADVRSAKAAHRCVPLILAHSVVCVGATSLLLLFAMLLGLLAQFALNIGDVAGNADIAMSKVSPVQWLQSLANAWFLGLTCVLTAVLYAWPGTQLAQRSVDAHRLGVRAMALSASMSVAAATSAWWLQNMLGF
jgi:hypothetical protein